MIYATPYSMDDLQPTGFSVDSGFATLDEVVDTMGADHIYRCRRFITYDSVVFSDFKFCIDETGNNG